MASILLVGATSFIGGGFRQAAGNDHDVTVVGHGADFAALDFRRFDTVVNTAYDPRNRTGVYDPEADIDLRIARAIARSGATCRYVLLSSRKVYGEFAPFPAGERAPIAPTDAYGTNKAITERAVRDVLGNRVAILRIANVFGDELGRRSFFGIACGSLRAEGFVRLDISPFTRRDFIHLDDLCLALVDIVASEFIGVLNVGSGEAVELGRIGLWLIEGYGSGRLICDEWRERDDFLLDNERLRNITRAGIGDVRSRCIEIGRKLKCEG